MGEVAGFSRTEGGVAFVGAERVERRRGVGGSSVAFLGFFDDGEAVVGAARVGTDG